MYFAFSLPVYCERYGMGLFGEPLNLVTNVAFLIAAVFAFRRAKQATMRKIYLLYLTFVLVLVGFGSLAFHAIPNHFTVLMDAISIYIFVASALLLLLERVTNSWRTAAAIVTGFIGIEVVASIAVPASFLNGSIRHVLTLLFAVGLLAVILKKFGKLALGLLPALILYVAALIARSIDQAICPSFPLGSHFLWHVFNGASCYFVITFLYELCHQPTSSST